MWKTTPDGLTAKVHGSAGRAMEIEPPDMEGEVGFGMSDGENELWAYVNAEDRVELIKFLIWLTPGWDQT